MEVYEVAPQHFYLQQLRKWEVNVKCFILG